MATVGACLRQIGLLDTSVFSGCSNLDEEFKILKKTYHKTILQQHPDKGGDPAAFRETQDAFDALRDMYTQKRLVSFADSPNMASGNAGYHGTGGDDIPSWQFYQDAAEEPVPLYRAEPAKSGRAKCAARGASVRHSDVFIAKDSIRVGHIDHEAGTYTHWNHLECWRVPFKVWLGLLDINLNDHAQVERALLSMNEVLLCGLDELSPSDLRLIAEHCENMENWAKLSSEKLMEKTGGAWHYKTGGKVPSRVDDSVPPPAAKRAKKGAAAAAATSAAGGKKATAMKEPAVKKGGGASAVKTEVQQQQQQHAVSLHSSKQQQQGAAPAGPSNQVAVAPPAKQQTQVAAYPRADGKFVMPVPGMGLARHNSLAGQTVVLTGIFPEVGGGTGLELGKARVKKMVESFGGRVTGSVSGRTSFLLVGREPGMSKVSKARSQPNCSLVDLQQIAGVLHGVNSLEDATSQTLKIDNFSSGYRGNGLARIANDEDLSNAGGYTARIENARPPSHASYGGGRGKRGRGGYGGYW